MTQSSSPAAKDSAKTVICELIAAAGGAMRGKVRLNKAFYFAHLYYWRDTSGFLTDYPIVRLPHGPAIDDATDLLNELDEEGKISISSSPVGPFLENVYRLADTTCTVDSSTSRGRAILEAVSFVADKTGAELSEITHEYSRSWVSTPNGHELNIYLDLVGEDELATVRKKLSEVRDREGAIWTTEF